MLSGCLFVYHACRLSPVTTSKVVFADDAKMRQYIHPDMLPDDTPGV